MSVRWIGKGRRGEHVDERIDEIAEAIRMRGRLRLRWWLMLVLLLLVALPGARDRRTIVIVVERTEELMGVIRRPTSERRVLVDGGQLFDKARVAVDAVRVLGADRTTKVTFTGMTKPSRRVTRPLVIAHRVGCESV